MTTPEQIDALYDKVIDLMSEMMAAGELPPPLQSLLQDLIDAVKDYQIDQGYTENHPQ